MRSLYRPTSMPYNLVTSSLRESSTQALAKQPIKLYHSTHQCMSSTPSPASSTPQIDKCLSSSIKMLTHQISTIQHQLSLRPFFTDTISATPIYPTETSAQHNTTLYKRRRQFSKLLYLGRRTVIRTNWKITVPNNLIC